MARPFANEFNVHSLHQEVTDVSMPQAVKRDRCHFGSGAALNAVLTTRNGASTGDEGSGVRGSDCRTGLVKVQRWDRERVPNATS